jgi:hypothetical protein
MNRIPYHKKIIFIEKTFLTFSIKEKFYLGDFFLMSDFSYFFTEIFLRN